MRFIIRLHFTIWAIVMMSLSGCKYENKWQPVNGNNRLTMEMPEWMKPAEGLYPDKKADLEYYNKFRNLYALALLDTPAIDDAAFVSLTERNTQRLKAALDKPLVTDSSELLVNNLKSVRTDIFGTMQGENIYYTQITIRGKKGIYTLCVWTRSEERKLRYKEDLDRMILSFKEL